MKFRHSNKAKRMSGWCNNHGSCKWCLGNRERQWRRLVGITHLGGDAVEDERRLYDGEVSNAEGD